MRLLRTCLVLILSSLALGACSSTEGECGAGQAIDGFCAYSTSAAIVIEGGFTCPIELPERFDFEGVVLCGPAGATPDRAGSICLSGGFECGPPSCEIAPDAEGCVPTGGVDAGVWACDAGPVDFCREDLGSGCCGSSVTPLCLTSGSGYECPEGSIPTTECGSCP